MSAILWFLGLPLGVRLAVVAIIGAVLAAAVNWAAYALPYEPRFHGPWSRKPPRELGFGPSDRLPIIGWWRLRRLAPQFGRGYWLRPLIIELLCVVGVPCWYWWETVRAGLWNPPFLGDAVVGNSTLGVVLHMQFLVHLVLGMFMLAASLIDADERTIPDSITIPGTLLGLTLLACLPLGLLPHYYNLQTKEFFWLHASEPAGLPTDWDPRSALGLLTGLACFAFWCWGLIFGGRLPPLRWNVVRLGRARRVMFTRIRRDPSVPWIAGGGVVGGVLISLVWNFDPHRWASLLTALIGMASGAGIVWIVRVLGSWAFQKEAMGFGDVTLMAMIGAYLGWQPAMIIFFAAPIAALVICLPSYLFGTREMLPYGPYLCAAAMAVMVAWQPIWAWAAPRFLFAWLVPGVLVVGFVILGVSLSLLRTVRSFGDR